ncbi:unnamed protein product [Danaus chrysippus]|uniref:(African queen) hypothetical protein n=1 Tax=Danaus chrysippus TaxID=151541 RepID=A0A8J2QGS5_9NEOP|nr:unnamed protein product [Danaus chrysippus]
MTTCLDAAGATPRNCVQTTEEVSERVRCARLWCYRHWSILCDPKLQRKVKFQIYKQFVRPIVTYGCETWCLDERSCKKLLRFECSVLLQVYKSKYPHRHPKRLRPKIKDVYCRYRDTHVVDHVRRQRLDWNQLLQCEENAWKRVQTKTGQQIHWWDN